jgi:hypothetical protein
MGDRDRLERLIGIAGMLIADAALRRMHTAATTAGLVEANVSAATNGAKTKAIAPITASIFAQMTRSAETGAVATWSGASSPEIDS